MAILEDKEIQDLEVSGFGLVFGSWPVVLGTLPGGDHWIRLLFVMLFLLGIDSAFSLMESFMICIDDTASFNSINRRYKALGLSIAGFSFSLLYATDAGLIFLDTMDYYINFVLLLVGGVKCFAAGWIYNIEEQVDNLGASIVFSYMTTTFGSVLLACIIWFSVDDANTAIWAGFLGLVVFYIAGMTFVCYLMHQRMQKYSAFWTWKSMLYDLLFRNMMDLRNDLSGVVGYIPVMWAFLIKYFIPPVILVLFSVGCAAKNSTGQTEFGHYGGYSLGPFQLLGISTVVFAGFLFFSSLVMPQLYDAFQKSNSPVPAKDAAIQVAFQETTTKDKGGVATFSLDSTPEGRVWPPRSINVSE